MMTSIIPCNALVSLISDSEQIIMADAVFSASPTLKCQWKLLSLLLICYYVAHKLFMPRSARHPSIHRPSSSEIVGQTFCEAEVNSMHE